jgi:hypothetical protein
MDPLTVAASIAGLLSLIVQVNPMRYKPVRILKNFVKDAQELSDGLDLLHHVLTRLETFLKEEALKRNAFKETSVLIDSVKGCTTKVLNIEARLKKIGSKRGLAQKIEQGKWYFEHDEHREIVTTLHRYIGVFQISLSIDGM